MRNHNRKRSCLAPKMKVKKMPEIDRVLEEAEAHILKPTPSPYELLNVCAREDLIAALWKAYEANLNALTALVGADSRIRIAKEKIRACIDDWKE